jgi:hypothetical protein
MRVYDFYLVNFLSCDLNITIKIEKCTKYNDYKIFYFC